jgi:hypothetical protein
MTLNGSFDFIGIVDRHKNTVNMRNAMKRRKRNENKSFYLFIFMMRTTPPIHCHCVLYGEGRRRKKCTQKTELQFSSGI